MKRGQAILGIPLVGYCKCFKPRAKPSSLSPNRKAMPGGPSKTLDSSTPQPDIDDDVHFYQILFSVTENNLETIPPEKNDPISTCQGPADVVAKQRLQGGKILRNNFGNSYQEFLDDWEA